MRTLACLILAAAVLGAPAPARSDVLFDFNDPALLHLPLPQTLTVGGITAQFDATGQGFSFQDTQQVIGVLPTGFSGLGLVPSSVFPADLIITFPSEVVTDFSIMVAPQELDTDSTATMRATAYRGATQVATTTSMGQPPFLWPSSTLHLSDPTGFDRVLVHYDSPPPTGGDFGPIFVADNMTATVRAVPEPSTLVLLSLGMCGGIVSWWRGGGLAGNTRDS